MNKNLLIIILYYIKLLFFIDLINTCFVGNFINCFTLLINCIVEMTEGSHREEFIITAN